MFTGIVAEIGTILRVRSSPESLELTIACSFADLEPGESIAVDGACLTVAATEPGSFAVNVVRTTAERTMFSQYAEGRRVNLERALRMGDRLGGHLVQGHVDGIGEVVRVTEGPNARLVDITAPEEVARLSIPLGSVAVDGVSLTVNARLDRARIQISLIPFTLHHTTLGERKLGDRVHLEADMFGKYIAALMEDRR
jgi:riboflavin synthase